MITSHHNPLLKDIRRLAARRERGGGRFVAESELVVRKLLPLGALALAADSAPTRATRSA